MSNEKPAGPTALAKLVQLIKTALDTKPPKNDPIFKGTVTIGNDSNGVNVGQQVDDFGDDYAELSLSTGSSSGVVIGGLADVGDADALGRGDMAVCYSQMKSYVDSKASGSGGGMFLITSSMDEELGDHVIDKTVDEVVAAYEAGQMIYLNNTNDSTFIPLSVMYKFISKYTFVFDRISYSKSGSTKTATLCRETLTGSTGGTLSTDYISTDGTLGRFTLT